MHGLDEAAQAARLNGRRHHRRRRGRPHRGARDSSPGRRLPRARVRIGARDQAARRRHQPAAALRPRAHRPRRGGWLAQRGRGAEGVRLVHAPRPADPHRALRPARGLCLSALFDPSRRSADGAVRGGEGAARAGLRRHGASLHRRRGGRRHAAFRRPAFAQGRSRDRRRRHQFGHPQAVLPQRGAAGVLEGEHLARRDAPQALPLGRHHLPRRRHLHHPQGGDLPDPQRHRRQGHAARQLGGRGVHAGAGAGRLEQARAAGRLSSSLRRLALRLARRRQADEGLGIPAHLSDGRPRSDPALDLRAREPARRCRAPDVSARRQRRRAGDPGCGRICTASEARRRSAQSL